MSQSRIPIIFGTAGFGGKDPYKEQKDIDEVFSVLKAHGVTTLDTAQLYGPSEVSLGKAKAADHFAIDTKWLGGWTKGWATEENVLKTAKESLEKVGCKKFDIFYIHAPDVSTPIASTLAGVNAAYKAGIFTRFGLSNYTPEQVQEVYDHCKSNGYPLPAVYQGNYSPVARIPEKELFPLLRKLKIKFFAYSPLAGGLLTKTRKEIEDGAGRFGEGQIYREIYLKPAYLDALSKWEAVAKDVGCTRAELAYRWVTWNSVLNVEDGDAMIVGASSVKQLEETLKGVEAGPLPEKAIKAIQEIWDVVEPSAPVDNFTR